jgi:hypothetical protein
MLRDKDQDTTNSKGGAAIEVKFGREMNHRRRLSDHQEEAGWMLGQCLPCPLPQMVIITKSVVILRQGYVLGGEIVKLRVNHDRPCVLYDGE